MSIKKIQSNGFILRKAIEIIASSEKNLVGLSGILIDETKNSFLLLTENGQKKIIKTKIFFKIDDKIYDGKDFQKTIENHI